MSLIGADHGDYAGLTQAIQSVRRLNDGPFVLYHRTLGTHFRFYLHDATMGDASHDVDLRWFPSAAYLADNAAKTAYPPRYLIEPDWAPLPNLSAHLAMRGLTMTNRANYGKFTVWEISHQPTSLCDWCVSRVAVSWPTHHFTDSPGTTPAHAHR